MHALYKQGLRELYEGHRESCGYGGRELVFVCEQIEEARRAKVRHETLMQEAPVQEALQAERLRASPGWRLHSYTPDNLQWFREATQ